MLRLAAFSGEVPRLHPRLLPEGFAQIARDVKLEDGSLVPLNEPRIEHTMRSKAKTIYLHKGKWLSWQNHVLNIVPGPVADDRLYITGSGQPQMYVDGKYYNLALPRPSQKLTIELVKKGLDADDSYNVADEKGNRIIDGDGNVLVHAKKSGTINKDTSETIIYTYTYVTKFGEESEPAPASKGVLWSKGINLILSNFAPMPNHARITRIRIYRSQTSTSGQTDFYFFKEVPANTKEFVDRIDAYPANEAIKAINYNAPPAGLSGITTLPNGMMAAFAGKKLYFCEPYQPHAWPEKYILTTESAIVGLGTIGQAVVVLTRGKPYVATGSSPEAMVLEQIDKGYPCLSARGIVDLGTTVAYPSPVGLVTISQSDGFKVATEELFTIDQWRALNPESFVASQFNGRYIATYADGLDVLQGSLVIDLMHGQPFVSRTDDVPTAWHHVAETGRLYLAQGRDISWFDSPRRVPRSMKWRSKKNVLAGHVNYGAILIESTEGETSRLVSIGRATISDAAAVPAVAVQTNGLAVKVYADGRLVSTVSKADRVERLPSGFLATTWEVEVTGNVPVSAVSLAVAPEELRE